MHFLTRAQAKFYHGTNFACIQLFVLDELIKTRWLKEVAYTT